MIIEFINRLLDKNLFYKMSELPPSDGTLYQIKSAINLLINERCKAHGITVPQAIQ